MHMIETQHLLWRDPGDADGGDGLATCQCVLSILVKSGGHSRGRVGGHVLGHLDQQRHKACLPSEDANGAHGKLVPRVRLEAGHFAAEQFLVVVGLNKGLGAPVSCRVMLAE